MERPYKKSNDVEMFARGAPSPPARAPRSEEWVCLVAIKNIKSNINNKISPWCCGGNDENKVKDKNEGGGCAGGDPPTPCRGPQDLRSGCHARGGAKAGGFWACHTCLAMTMMMVLVVVTMMMLMVMVVIVAQNINETKQVGS